MTVLEKIRAAYAAISVKELLVALIVILAYQGCKQREIAEQLWSVSYEISTIRR